ncbi:MAG: crotonase/enoyl-CoA hydratase family protein [Proteobacteria bacterium]|jgi:DSF synthase|nr:crotonase/enoyl-CoA hydratase family protein [Pseudomonadota bacterium]MCG6935446.1 crotonase/enoyl-CoA hydratase family protein [Pseudomonadota bacterium]
MNLAEHLHTPSLGTYTQLAHHYDSERECIWCELHGSPRPCFTPTLLSELAVFLEKVEQSARDGELPVSYFVTSSNVPGVFNLGGDLHLFQQYIADKNRAGLMAYAKACINVLYTNAVHMNLPITTIALVQGSALGGGFEAAISSSVVIAEKGTELGLPEILFNLFPGMGAYSLLARKIGMRQAEELITAGRLFGAEELHERGVVDILAEPGTGVEAVHDYIRQHGRSRNGLTAINRVREYLNPITYEELLDITEIWVDAALHLTSRDLRLMKKLVNAQDRGQQEVQKKPGVQLAAV